MFFFASSRQAESDYDAVSEESIAGNDSLIVEKCPGDIASYHDKDSLDGDFFNDDKSEYGSEPGSSSDDIANEPHSSPNRVAPKEMQRDLTKEKDLQENGTHRISNGIFLGPFSIFSLLQMMMMQPFASNGWIQLKTKR